MFADKPREALILRADDDDQRAVDARGSRHRHLALAGLVNLVVYAPALWVLAQLATGGFGWTAAWPGPNAAVPDAGVQLGLLWLGFAGVYMGMRALTLGWRARRDDWMRLGVV